MKAIPPITVVLVLFLSLAGVAYATCSWCGSSSYGSCPYAKSHKHTDCGADKCMFCGSSSYGSCSLSPHGKHEHGIGDAGSALAGCRKESPMSGASNSFERSCT